MLAKDMLYSYYLVLGDMSWSFEYLNKKGSVQSFIIMQFRVRCKEST